MIPESRGQINQATGIAAVVTITLLTALLIPFQSSDAGVSILLVGSALFSGFNATTGKHRLVSQVFSGPRKAAAFVALAAVVGSIATAIDIQGHCRIWILAAISLMSIGATARLALSRFRSAR